MTSGRYNGLASELYGYAVLISPALAVMSAVPVTSPEVSVAVAIPVVVRAL